MCQNYLRSERPYLYFVYTGVNKEEDVMMMMNYLYYRHTQRPDQGLVVLGARHDTEVPSPRPYNLRP